MIACDTSSLSAFLAGDPNARDVVLLRQALRDGTLVLPPATLTEILSNPASANVATTLTRDLALLPIDAGYWRRAAENRAILIGKKLKARLADALIAQSCIDAEIALITRDRDFRHFAQHCGLKLA